MCHPDQQRHGAGLAHASACVPEQKVLQQVELLGVAALDERERRRARHGINRRRAGRGGFGARREAPRCHRPRERYQHERARRERRIERVVAEPAERLLRDRDREHAAYYRHPERKIRREVQREQKTRQHGGKVAYAAFALHGEAAKSLGHHGRSDARDHQPHRTHAEEPHSAPRRWQERDDYVAHHRAYAVPRVRVG